MTDYEQLYYDPLYEIKQLTARINKFIRYIKRGR